MYIKTALCAAWLASASAFAPTPFSQSMIRSSNTEASSTSKSSALHAAVENAAAVFPTNPRFEPMPKTTTVAAVPKLAQRWRKSTKQLATLGPASSTKEMIEKLFLAGADVFRLNFSHGSQEQKKELLLMIRVSSAFLCSHDV